MEYGEYTTVNAIRSTYEGSTDTSLDALLLQIIRAKSREINAISNRKFYPRIETRSFDTPPAPDLPLYFDDDLLELTTLTNGNGNAFTAAQYKLRPLNGYPKEEVGILGSSSEQWQPTTKGDLEGAVSALGIWGYHPNYGTAWQDVGAKFSTDLTASGASDTIATGLLFAGDLLKLESEYVYVSAVTVGTPDTVTLVRGVNGSTAAAHTAASVVVYRWTVEEEVEMLCRIAVVAEQRLKDNPIGETVVYAGQQFQTPKDIAKFMAQRLADLGLIRTGIG